MMTRQNTQDTMVLNSGPLTSQNRGKRVKLIASFRHGTGVRIPVVLWFILVLCLWLSTALAQQSQSIAQVRALGLCCSGVLCVEGWPTRKAEEWR